MNTIPNSQNKSNPQSQQFYQLSSQEWIDCFTKLTRSQLGVLIYVRTLDPYGDCPVSIDHNVIGNKLKISRATVYNALKKLESEGYITLQKRQRMFRSFATTQILEDI
jgi:DNA-binding MarR family transcriptional regulator